MSIVSTPQIPAYCHHKATGLAYVTLSGRTIYLSKHGSANSRAEYERRIAEWLAAGRTLPADPNETTVAEVVSAFRKHAKSYYKNADGKVSVTVANFDQALRPLLKLYGRTRAIQFGPLRLKTVRDQMVKDGWARTNINRHITRIRGVFKWATENELIPPSIHQGLMAVAGLRFGRCEAKESEPVKPVPAEYVHATLPHVARQVAAMIRLQSITGMRPGEVILMRSADIDTTGNLWMYKPQHHKAQIHGHTREIYLGPKAQEILKPFLKPDLTANLFSPADAERERRERLHASRKTPLSCGNRPGSNKARKPRRVPGERYTVMSFYRAIMRGCDKADEWAKGGQVVGNDERLIPRWHPHQLRHTAATELRKSHGIEAAQVLLGHRTLNVTELYAEKNVAAAMRIAAAVG